MPPSTIGDSLVIVSFKWDMRFLDLACLVSTWSKDPSTRTGAVIVRPDRTVASIGYNGFPRGMVDSDERLESREEKYSRVVHCEVNALIHAHEPLRGYTLYTYPFLSCDRCFVQLAQAGITRFVAPVCPVTKRDRWEAVFEKVRAYAEELNVTIDEIHYQ